ncbi:unnamed protein product [Lampetra fluviatilis]
MMDARQLDHVAVDLERAAGLSHHKTSMQQQQPLSPSKVLVVPQRRANVSNHMPTVGTALHISRAVMYVPELKSKRSGERGSPGALAISLARSQM